MEKLGGVSQLSYTTYLPSVKKEDKASDPTELLFQLIRDSQHQQRNAEVMQRHLLLDIAANRKAQDLAQRDYFAHTSPDGITANQNVAKVGYSLPDYYFKVSNCVESLSIGGSTLQQVADGWYKSDKHRPHVYAEDDFYRKQNCIGVGSAVAKDGRMIFVFISAPCP